MDSRVKDMLDAQDKRIAALETKVAGLEPLFTEARGAFDRVAERLDPKPAERLDLATLEVPCAEFPTRHAFISGGELSIENGAAMVSLVLNVDNSRLLARALTQWADEQEGKGS